MQLGLLSGRQETPATEAASARKERRGASKPAWCVLVFDSKALELWSRNPVPGAPVSAAGRPAVSHGAAREAAAALPGRHGEHLGQTGLWHCLGVGAAVPGHGAVAQQKSSCKGQLMAAALGSSW